MIKAKREGDDIEIFVSGIHRGLEGATAKVALRIAQDAAGELTEQVMASLTKDPTGALARSFVARLVASGDTVSTAEAASDLPYAGIQDHGGVIRPKRARALAIPIPGRVPRGMGPKQYPAKLHVQKTERGAILADEKGRAIFALKKSVKIAGVKYVAAAMAALKPRMAEVAKLELDEIVGQAGKDAAGKAGK